MPGNKLGNLSNAVGRLREALDCSPVSELVIDGTIQRFEFTFELCWKTMKYFLEREGVAAGTPKATLQKAFAARWIDDEALWVKMLEDRNRTSHTYHEALAHEIFERIPSYLPEFERALRFLQERADA